MKKADINKSFEGYARETYYNILKETFSPYGIVTLQDFIAPQVLKQIPVLNFVNHLCKMIEREGELKLTARGYLPKRIVKEFHTSEIMLDFTPYPELMEDINIEIESQYLPYFRELLKKLGIVKKRHNKLSLTKKGRQLLSDQEKLLNGLIRAVFRDNIICNVFGNNLHEIVHSLAGYFLILLGKYGDKARLLDFYYEKLTDLLKFIFKKGDEKRNLDEADIKALTDGIKLSLLRSFRFFNFVDKFDSFSSSPDFKRSSVFDQLIKIKSPEEVSELFEDQRKPMIPAEGSYATEKVLKEITKLLQDKEFESEEEVAAYVDNFIKDYNEKIFNEEDTSEDFYLESIISSSPKKKYRLLKKAIKADPTNVDALIDEAILGKYTPAARVKRFREIIALAKDQIGDDFAEYEEEQAFWGFVETRPYMKALDALASYQLIRKNFEEATEIMQRMLKLNPNDNQDIRHRLAPLLVMLERYDEYLELKEKYDDGMDTGWIYTYVLYIFKREGISRNLVRNLVKAYKQNKYLMKLIIQEIKLPDEEPDTYIPGSYEEAVIVFVDLHFLLNSLDNVNELLEFIDNFPFVNR